MDMFWRLVRFAGYCVGALVLLALIGIFTMNARRPQPTVTINVTQEEIDSYREVAARFDTGEFEGLGEEIEKRIAKLPSDSPVRPHFVMAMAKLGQDDAEKAAAFLAGWEDVFAGDSEAFRLGSLGDIHLYYLDKPEDAVAYYERCLPLVPSVAYNPLSSLFSAYSGHRRTFDRGKAAACLEKLGEFPDSPHFATATMIHLAMSGDREKAERKLQWLESALSRDEIPVSRVYCAPVWGWLGDAEKAVAYLEPGLREQAIGYAPEGFRLYCDWIRQSPAYDAIREHEAFGAMWDRLYAFVPERHAKQAAP